MPYIITNGSSYIQTGSDNRPTTTGNIDKARLFDIKTKAQNCCVCLPNALKRFGFYVQEVSAKTVGDPDPAPVPASETVTGRFANMPLHQDVPPAEDLDGRVLDMDYIISEMSRFEEFVDLMCSSMPAVRQQLAHAEAQIFDIEHAAELERLNVYQGFKIYKALHDARIMRRKCKDTLSVIEQLKCVVTDGLLDHSISLHINGLGERTYTPRAIPELFDDIKRRTKE